LPKMWVHTGSYASCRLWGDYDKSRGRWICNACGEEVGKEIPDYVICAKWGHEFKGNWVEMDIPL